MRLKRRLRSVIEIAAARSGILERFERAAHDGLTVLTYHRVLPARESARYPFPSLAMPVEAFREQMRRLAAQFEVVTVSAGLQRVLEGRHAERPLAAVTFDDGYADNASIAAPILDELGIHGTFLLVFDFVARARPLWFDRAAVRLEDAGLDIDAIQGLKRLTPDERDRAIDALGPPVTKAGKHDMRPMSREQALDLHRRGHEIGSHTLGHPVLTHLGDADLEREVAGSKAELEAWLGIGIHGFCYPNGDHDERVRARVRAVGYRWACSTAPGRNRADLDPFDIQRIDVTPSRVTDHAGSYSELAFRSEISLLRRALRGDRG